MIPPLCVVVAIPVTVAVTIGIIRKIRNLQWGQCNSSHSLRGRTFLITGANSGIGLETAKELVKRNARVIFACRDVQSAKKAIAEIRKKQPRGGEMIPMQLDLASFDSIKSFANLVHQGFGKIDVLINNAGVAIPLAQDQKTKEGFEIHFGVNHLGHVLLTDLLLDMLKKSAPSRIVIVSSTLHEKAKIDFDDLNLRKAIEGAKSGKLSSRSNPGYNVSKLMNVYTARYLADKLNNFGIDVHAVCPGFTNTNLFRHSFKWYHYMLMAPIFLFYLRSANKGAQTVLYCATDYAVEGKTGQFYRDCQVYESKHEFDKETENKLWTVSQELIVAGKPL